MPNAEAARVHAPCIDAHVGWTRQANRNCLRGLRFDYHAPRHWFDAPQFEGELQRQFNRQVLAAREPLGRASILRLLLQFRFEVRLGPAPSDFSVLHRLTPTPAQRQSDRLLIEAIARKVAIEASS